VHKKALRLTHAHEGPGKNKKTTWGPGEGTANAPRRFAPQAERKGGGGVLGPWEQS